MGKKRRPWLRWGFLGLGLFLLYQLATGPNGLLKLASLRRDQAEQKSRVDSLLTRQAELEAEKKRLLADSAYLEKLARQELGMAKPGEKVYRLLSPGDSIGSRP